ncbi:MAG: hypothetical protein ACKO96_15290 [Flammeovirgaceae bacterium]
MTTQDLKNNRDRIIKKIKFQITMATNDQIAGVMNKMLAMLPQFAAEKATMANIDKLTSKATLSYIKFDLTHTAKQIVAVDASIETKRRDSLPSSLRAD